MKEQETPKSDLTKFLEQLTTSFDPKLDKKFSNHIDFRQAKIHYEAIKSFEASQKKPNDGK